jgi:hypothetical protein
MEDEVNSTPQVFSEAIGALPAPVKKAFTRALDSFFGGLIAIPAAALKRRAQAIDDLTAAKSIVSTAIAKAAADGAIKDPALIQAAVEALMPSALRKVINLQKAAESAADHLANDTADGSSAEAPSDDWLNRFMRLAEDASSERLQDLFGRILAGEIMRPGRISLSTLRVVSELDQKIADDFSAAWALSVGGEVDYSPEWQRGEWFQRWQRLREAGLMASAETLQFLPPFNPIFQGRSLWSPMSVGSTFVNVHFTQDSSANWRHIEFTRVGRELRAR